VRRQMASWAARASTVIARASSLSAGSLRWAWASVRRMFARVIASTWSDFLRETQCRSVTWNLLSR
jgi:hypothetical protein